LLPERSLPLAQKLELQRKLRDFYASVDDYTAFNQPSAQSHCWEAVGTDILARLNTENSDESAIRILEVGSGRSGLSQWMNAKGLRSKVHLTCQDVTAQNVDWLERYCDSVVVGNLDQIAACDGFDVIVSTYVLEHVADPSSHLDRLNSLLRPGGCIFLFCPRYDFPGYLCPSTRHLGVLSRFRLSMLMLRFRLASVLRREPAFLIQTDLAAFHGPFFLDADAVHWVSRLDLELWAERASLGFRRLAVGNPRPWTKDWIVKRWLTCAVEFRKDRVSE
jgi:2-polyprenyl-3-methyl-5-hydroxy-6-metoxy-1,4-benzoquinol methylase